MTINELKPYEKRAHKIMNELWTKVILEKIIERLKTIQEPYSCYDIWAELQVYGKINVKSCPSVLARLLEDIVRDEVLDIVKIIFRDEENDISDFLKPLEGKENK